MASAFSFAFARGATKFLIVEFAADANLVGPGMHATNTLDYGILLSGRITLVTETGETTLAPGDLLVGRGVLHGWRNAGPGAAQRRFVHHKTAPAAGGPN